MKKAIARFGDSTTTGGKIIHASSGMYDDNKLIALSGDKATCGKCKGLFKISGTGEGVSDNGRAVVVHGDLVLCPCKHNRIISGSNAGCFISDDSGSGATPYQSPTTMKDPCTESWRSFDELIVLKDEEGQPVANQRYRITAPNGQIFEGTTDEFGETQRINTKSAQHIFIELL